MIGELIFQGRDGKRAMRLGGVSTLAQLTTLATALQTYTNAAIVQARLWVPQELTGLPAAATEKGFDLVSAKAIMTFSRTGQPNGKAAVSRLSWPAPKSTMFDLVSSKTGSKAGGYRVTSTAGNAFVTAIETAGNRDLAFHKGWLNVKK